MDTADQKTTPIASGPAGVTAANNDDKTRPAETQAVPYTTLSPLQKQLLRFLLGLATITSPLTATIYFPLLPLLREHFHTSAQAINLTLTVYIIFQAVSPAIFGPLSDSLGRRPVYLFTLALYILGNLGLAANKDSYAVLLVLRALQSLGASAAFAVSYGVVADVCMPSERGSMLGPVSMSLNLGACVGPVVGGWVTYKSGRYEWVFWALMIVGVILWVGVGALLPETARTLVGNGTVDAGRKWWEESWWSIGRRWLTEEPVKVSNNGNQGNNESEKEGFLQKCRIHNPLACLCIIFHFDTFLTLWMHGSFYTVDYSLVAAVPDIYQDVYHFNELQIGLAYLPRGAGIILGGYLNGKLMDRNYKATARESGWTVDGVAGDDLHCFPIERARARGSCWLLATSTATLVGYGWAIRAHVHVSVPLILQFVQGFWGTCFYTTYNTLLVDVFPESPSTAAAAASIMRCAMAAAGVAISQPLLDATGRGWYYSVLGIWSGGCGWIAVLMIKKKGMDWRRRRETKRAGGLLMEPSSKA